MYSRIVSVLSNAGTGTQDITFSGGTSFTPKMAIFQWSRANTSADTFQEHMSTGYGFTDGTNQRCIAVSSEDNQARGDSARIQRNNAVICTLNPSGTVETVDSVAAFSQWLTNGIQINWTDAPAAQFYLTVLLIGGNDVSNIAIGSVLTTTGASASLSSLSWQPENGLFLSVGSTTENSPVVGAMMSIGAYDGTNQWTQGYLSQDNPVTMITRQNYQHNRVIDVPTTAGATDGYSTIAWTSTGFTLTNTDTYSASFPVYYLVWKGGTCVVGNSTEPAGTGQQTITTNEDVQAVMILGVDSGTAGWQAGAMWTSGMGVSTTERYVNVFEDTNGVADSIVVSRHDTDQLYLNITSNLTATSSTLDDEATFYSKSSTNFLINWTNIGQARPFRYITFGSGAALNPVSISDTPVVSVSETLARVQTINKAISDTPSVTVGAGAVTGAKLYSRSISETSVSVGAGSIEAEREVGRSISDTPTVSVSDSLVKAATYPRPISNEGSVSASDTIGREADYTKSIEESQLSISDSIAGTKIPSGPTAKLWDVHFVEFPEDILDSVEVVKLGAAVTAEKTHKYDIIGKVSTTKTHKYTILNPIQVTKTHKYSVLATVASTKTHKYNVLSAISTTKTHKYSILQQITRTRTHLYNVLNTISTTKTHKYNVSAGLEQVTTTKTHKYHILTQISTTKTHRYSIEVKVTTTKTHKFDVLVTIAATKTHKYSLVNAASTTKTHKYNVISRVTTTKTHKYDISGPISTTKTHKYNILNTISTSKTHKYSLLSVVTPAASKTHKYSVISAVSAAKTHIYVIYQRVAQTRTHKYSLIHKIDTTKTHRYNISTLVAQTKTHKFSLLVAATRTRTHKYNIIGRITATKTHKWNEGGKVTATKIHKYEVGSGSEIRELGGSTHAFIKFPERVHIVDIISEIRNLALANVEIITAIPPSNIAIAFVEIESQESRLPLALRTASSKFRFRIASQLIVPQVQDTIENRAIAPYIAIEVLPLLEKPQLQLRAATLIQQHDQEIISLKAYTQIKQSADTIIKIASATTIDPNVMTRVASLANLQLPYDFARQLIRVPEIMSREAANLIKAIIDILKSDDFFK